MKFHLTKVSIINKIYFFNKTEKMSLSVDTCVKEKN